MNKPLSILSLLLLLSACAHTDTAPLAAVDTPPPPDTLATLPPVAVDEANELKKIYFEFDGSTFRNTELNSLKYDIQWLKKHPKARISIEGHCDEKEADIDNKAVAEKRAAAVKQYFVKRGISSSRISTSALGADRPQDSGHDDAAYAQNRRVSFKILLP